MKYPAPGLADDEYRESYYWYSRFEKSSTDKACVSRAETSRTCIGYDRVQWRSPQSEIQADMDSARWTSVHNNIAWNEFERLWPAVHA